MNATQKLLLFLLRLQLKILTILSPKKAAEKAFQIFCTPFFSRKIARPSVFAAAKKINVNLHEKKIIGYRWGNHPAKKVLILHGFGSQAYKFHALVYPLQKKGFEVIAFDAPAHGDSQGKSLNVLEYSDMIEAIIQNFGPFNAYIAHSLGGLALGITAEKMKFNAQERLVLIAPVTETRSAIKQAFELLQINSKKVRKNFDDLIYTYSGRKVEWFSLNRAVKNIAVPILWIHDEEDEITPYADTAPSRKENLANVDFFITSGLGHKKIYRNEMIIKKTMAFFD